MATPFLQGLTKAMDMLEHDLESDAKGLMTKIQGVGQRGKAAIGKGHARIDGVASRVAEVDKFVTEIEGSNGGDPLDSSSGSSEEPQVQDEADASRSAADPSGTTAAQAEPAASWGAKPNV